LVHKLLLLLLLGHSLVGHVLPKEIDLCLNARYGSMKLFHGRLFFLWLQRVIELVYDIGAKQQKAAISGWPCLSGLRQLLQRLPLHVLRHELVKELDLTLDSFQALHRMLPFLVDLALVVLDSLLIVKISVLPFKLLVHRLRFLT
jgi:hypothetical protein